MRFRLYLCFSHGKNWRQLLLPLPFILKYIYLAYGQILFISLFVSLFLYLSVFICLLVFPHFTADKNQTEHQVTAINCRRHSIDALPKTYHIPAVFPCRKRSQHASESLWFVLRLHAVQIFHSDTVIKHGCASSRDSRQSMLIAPTSCSAQLIGLNGISFSVVCVSYFHTINFNPYFYTLIINSSWTVMIKL